MEHAGCLLEILSIYLRASLSHQFRYVETSPLHFTEVGDTNWLYPQIVFKENDNGIALMIFDTDTLERIHLYDGKAFLIMSVTFFTSVFLLYPLLKLLHVCIWWRKQKELWNIQYYRYEVKGAGWLIPPRHLALAGRMVS